MVRLFNSSAGRGGLKRQGEPGVVSFWRLLITRFANILCFIFTVYDFDDAASIIARALISWIYPTRVSSASYKSYFSHSQVPCTAVCLMVNGFRALCSLVPCYS